MSYISDSETGIKESKAFADLLLQELQGLEGMQVNGTSRSAYAVLKHKASPALLLELGYLSNQADLDFLSDKSKLSALSERIVSAIRKYKY